MAKGRKIINDPVYGFITIDHPLLFSVIGHPYYQRLRRIQQMAFAHLVYPGAVHSRLHHSLGSYHLMCIALRELQNKGVMLSAEEELGAKIAILLHDIGHGPFSHALEHTLIEGVHHESISLQIMEVLNQENKGALQTAIAIFNNSYHLPFLHQLVSGQLDVDRMDYLTRDSFFTGVSEGVIGYDRIIKMLTVQDGQLMVEEKGIFSIEKFLVARRLMYWQVYLHKTVLGAEKLLVNIIRRAKDLIQKGISLPVASPVLEQFLSQKTTADLGTQLDAFCQLDDYDLMAAVKCWALQPDRVLSTLCRMLLNRRLLKVKLQADPLEPGLMQEIRGKLIRATGFTAEEIGYFVFDGETSNTTYDPAEERIQVLFKDGTVRDISQVDNALIQHNLSRPLKKYYFCYLDPELAIKELQGRTN
ncbi:HD domain-containing protein [Flavihumibacter sp. CACIAM 22H1]|uniref:HD domain-containing protein n=1 Tax=Flavihumibacter sp. CACIAM 22H1 TaxID=1812911 RepID=UPI0007A8B21F|nr:HD domain-containing protein [Flavihumibacter sp. CACIAM 22H1]KYP16447.1 MAG: phosphohydrolase [Flavihumibacter sp. CACIAM 22H1]